MENQDAFRLTAVDVRRYDFGTALRGYDKARVDQFREQVAEELERLARANQDIEAKARGFHEQLRAFRERDKALNEALVSAQQLRGDMKAQASGEAELILRQAHAEAERIASGARAQLASLKGEIERLDRTRRTYLAQLRILAERHLAEVLAAEKQPPPVFDGRGTGAAGSGSAASGAPAPADPQG
jgi:DivIVA domain-containing protein